MWRRKSYQTKKSLGGYTKDLSERLQWFAEWLQNGQPDIFYLSRFYFPQALLTGILQIYARKNNIAVDELGMDFKVLTDPASAKPDHGAIVTGMFIEGCKWSDEEYSLVESDPKVLFTKFPQVWIKPCKPADFSKD